MNYKSTIITPLKSRVSSMGHYFSFILCICVDLQLSRREIELFQGKHTHSELYCINYWILLCSAFFWGRYSSRLILIVKCILIYYSDNKNEIVHLKRKISFQREQKSRQLYKDILNFFFCIAKLMIFMRTFTIVLVFLFTFFIQLNLAFCVYNKLSKGYFYVESETGRASSTK